MNFFFFHIGDYASATRHLSWEEDLAYRRLMDVYYSREEPLPADKKAIYRLIMAETAKHRQAIDAVLAEFFTLAPEGFRNARCDEELSAHASKRDKAKQSAAARWNRDGAKPPHNEGNANAYATAPPDAMRTQCEGNAPTTHFPLPSKDDDDSRAREPDPFEACDQALRAIPGISSHPVFASAVIAPIWQLSVKGYDLKTQIIPSIARQIANSKRPIGNWAYFVEGIVSDATPSPIKPNGGHNGQAQHAPSLSPRQVHLAKLKQRAVDAKLREIGEGGDSGGPDIQGPARDAN